MNTMTQNIKKLADVLYTDKNFQDICSYVFKYVEVCGMAAGRSINYGFNTQAAFVNTFCHKMPYFPASLFHDDMTLTTTEIAECKNYIICNLFLTICIDKFIDKYRKDEHAQSHIFSGCSFNVTYNTYMNTGVISFAMLQEDISHLFQVTIQLPAFTTTKYEDFDSIKTFLNADDAKMIVKFEPQDSKATTITQVRASVKEFYDLPGFFNDELIEYLMENNL